MPAGIFSPFMHIHRPHVALSLAGMGLYISARLRIIISNQGSQARHADTVYRPSTQFHRTCRKVRQSSGLGTTSSPVVIPAMLVVALLVVAVCFGTTATARPSHTDTDAMIRLPSSAGAGGRPWECCDWVTQDPTFRPPKWRCNDVVDNCSADCQQCEASAAGDGDGFVCRDWIFSLFEPPVCTPRPWDCCDLAACTRDYIPYCRCTDKVESCPSNCKECELVESESESDPPRYRCLDVFHGYPGPKCTYAMGQ